MPSTSNELGKLILRVVLGVLILFHGVSKLIHGPGFVVQVLAQQGLPSFLAYGVYVGEVVAPLLLILGLWTRIGALIVAVNMVVALLLVHTAQFMSLADTGGWALELQGMYLGGAIAVLLLGGGRLSLGSTYSRWT